jgi:hypothetical protein
MLVIGHWSLQPTLFSLHLVTVPPLIVTIINSPNKSLTTIYVEVCYRAEGRMEKK